MSICKKIASVLSPLGQPSESALYNAVRSLRISVEELTDYLEPPCGRPYARRQLEGFGNPDVEVLVMNWASGKECMAHDHGNSFGSFLVVTGEVKERRFSFSDETQLAVTGSTHYSTGDVVTAPRGLIHSMVNSSVAPLVTLHFYSPPIEMMRVFAPERCQGCIVTQCGAWWPTKDQMVKDFPVAAELRILK